VEAALQSLTFVGEGSAWLESFEKEISSSYSSVATYVRGEQPDFAHWGDVRARCLAAEAGRSELDRRVWTWEVRLSESPRSDKIEAIVLSHEAFKEFEHLVDAGAAIPGRLRVVHGGVSPAGVHYFSDATVSDLLLGKT
jgi:hypothetical protein